MRGDDRTRIMWSTGISKNPCICGACRSIVRMRSAPAAVSRSATSLARSDRGRARPCPGARTRNRNHGRDTARRRTLRSVDHDEQFRGANVDGFAAGSGTRHSRGPFPAVRCAFPVAELRDQRLAQRPVQFFQRSPASSGFAFPVKSLMFVPCVIISVSPSCVWPTSLLC